MLPDQARRAADREALESLWEKIGQVDRVLWESPVCSIPGTPMPIIVAGLLLTITRCENHLFLDDSRRDPPCD